MEARAAAAESRKTVREVMIRYSLKGSHLTYLLNLFLNNYSGYSVRIN